MTLAHENAIRDAFRNAVNAPWLTNPGGNMTLYEGGIGGEAICVITPLNDPTWTITTTGEMDLAVPPTPQGTVAGAAPPFEVNAFQMFDGAGTPAPVFNGSVSGTGLGGDMEITNINLNNGDIVTLDSMTYVASV